MTLVGYALISTTDENNQLQLEALKKAGCEQIYIDHGFSGMRSSRPELDLMLSQLRSGKDEVLVWKLDRLARNTPDLLELIDDLESRDIHFRTLTEGIATTGPMGKATHVVLSAFVRFERDQVAERTRAKKAASTANGRPAGRRKVTLAQEKVNRSHHLRAQGLKPTEIAKILGVSRATTYRYLSIKNLPHDSDEMV